MIAFSSTGAAAVAAAAVVVVSLTSTGAASAAAVASLTSTGAAVAAVDAFGAGAALGAGGLVAAAAAAALGTGGLVMGFPATADALGLATTDMRAKVAAPAFAPNDEYSGRVLSSGTSTFFLAVVGRDAEPRLNSLGTVGAFFVTRGTPMSPADSRIFLLTYPRGRRGTEGSFIGGIFLAESGRLFVRLGVSRGTPPFKDDLASWVYVQRNS